MDGPREEGRKFAIDALTKKTIEHIGLSFRIRTLENIIDAEAASYYATIAQKHAVLAGYISRILDVWDYRLTEMMRNQRRFVRTDGVCLAVGDLRGEVDRVMGRAMRGVVDSTRVVNGMRDLYKKDELSPDTCGCTQNSQDTHAAILAALEKHPRVMVWLCDVHYSIQFSLPCVETEAEYKVCVDPVRERYMYCCILHKHV